jgi:hypothetical protein
MLLIPVLAGACQCPARPYAPGSTLRDVRSLHIRNLDDKSIVIEGVVERQLVRLDSSVPADRWWQNYRLVIVRATAVYRGPKQEKFEVKTGLGGGDCGFDFETGESYLIYARRNEKGALLTSTCSETRVVEYAGPDLRILRGEPPAPEDSLDPETYQKHFWAEYSRNVCGRVIRSDGTPASGASIQLVRERHDGFPPRGWYADSKPDGAYCFEYVPRGRYFVSARQDDEKNGTRFVGALSKSWRPLAIRVESGKAVSGLKLVLRRDLLYSGRRHALLGSIIAGVVLVGLVVFWRWRTQWAA